MYPDSPSQAISELAERIAARQRGLFIRPLGPSLYLWPPLTVTPEELAKMLALLDAAIAHA